MSPAIATRYVLRSPLTNALEGQDLTKKGVGKHLQPGVVTYDEVKDEKTGEVLQPKITYLLTLEAIAKMRPTAQGKPVVGKSGGFDHVKVQPGVKYDGVVTDGFWDGESGWESINFRLDDKKTAEACAKGFQFSCAYIPTEVEEKPGLWHNVPYDAVILDGEYTHFAVVPNPRYDGATIELLNRKEPTVMNKILKAALSLIPRTEVREVLNALEEEDKKVADEKAAAEKKNADEKAAKKAEAQKAFDESMKNAKTPEEQEAAKKALEKANADIEAGIGGETQDPAAAAPAAAPAQPKADLPPQPLGGGDVTAEPGVPAQQVDPAKNAAAAPAETPEQAQEREKKALEAKNAEDAAAAKKKEDDEKAEKERVNALELKNKAEAKAKEDAERRERFNALRRTAEERGGSVGAPFITITTVADKENLGRERYGSKQQ